MTATTGSAGYFCVFCGESMATVDHVPATSRTAAAAAYGYCTVCKRTEYAEQYEPALEGPTQRPMRQDSRSAVDEPWDPPQHVLDAEAGAERRAEAVMPTRDWREDGVATETPTPGADDMSSDSRRGHKPDSATPHASAQREAEARTLIHHALANIAAEWLKHTWGYGFDRERVNAVRVTADESWLMSGGQMWDLTLKDDPELRVAVIETPYEWAGWAYQAIEAGGWKFDLLDLYDHSSPHDQSLMAMIRSISWHCIAVSGLADR